MSNEILLINLVWVIFSALALYVMYRDSKNSERDYLETIHRLENIITEIFETLEDKNEQR